MYKFDSAYNLSSELALNVSDHYPVEFQLRAAVPSSLSLPESAATEDRLRIGAFNVQVFGKAKLQRPRVLPILVDVSVINHKTASEKVLDCHYTEAVTKRKTQRERES